MASIVENWADVTARVESVEAAEDVPEHASANIRVTKVTGVPGFPNLLEDAAGQTLRVQIRRGTSAEKRLKQGATIRLRLRRGGSGQIFAHPDAP